MFVYVSILFSPEDIFGIKSSHGDGQSQCAVFEKNEVADYVNKGGKGGKFRWLLELRSFRY